MHRGVSCHLLGVKWLTVLLGRNFWDSGPDFVEGAIWVDAVDGDGIGALADVGEAADGGHFARFEGDAIAITFVHVPAQDQAWFEQVHEQSSVFIADAFVFGAAADVFEVEGIFGIDDPIGPFVHDEDVDGFEVGQAVDIVFAKVGEFFA